jgi:phosphorylcholine metabolism protein LicD
MGIHLGIIPLDYLPDNYEEVYKEVHELILDNSTYMKLKNPHLSDRDRERVANYKGNPPLETYEKIHAISRSAKPSTKIWTAALHGHGLLNDMFELEDFSEIVWLPFETLEVPAPKGYKRVLSNAYGDDYMDIPPMTRRHRVHRNIVVDADRPYAEVLNEMLNEEGDAVSDAK